MMLHHQFFILLQVSLGKAESFPSVLTTEEWEQLYRLAVEQSLVGVLYDGLQRLPSHQMPPKELIRKWFRDTNAIERKYMQMSQLTLSVMRRFEADGYRVCLLKGIGNSLNYPNPKVRQCGDVDVWIDASAATAIRYVHRYRPGSKALYHNVEMSVNNILGVDVHYRPSYLYNFLGDRRLQRYFGQWKEEQFCHKVDIGNGELVSVPTRLFNLVYLVCHFNHHLFNEGIGLRQLIDFYYVMLKSSAEELRQAQQILEEVGLGKLTRALMYIMREMLLMDNHFLIDVPDEVAGRFLLDEILASGNFGQSAEGAEKKRNKMERNWRRLTRIFRLMPVFSTEAFCEPLFRVYQWLWRQWMKRY